MQSLTPGAFHHTPHCFYLGGFERRRFLCRSASKETTAFVWEDCSHPNRNTWLFCVRLSFVTHICPLQWQRDCHSVCQTVGMWFLMWVKGKFGDWGATTCGIKDTRVKKKKRKKNLVWVLYRKVAFVCTEPSHLCVSLCVQLSRDRQTDGWIRDRTTGLRSTLWDLVIRSKCLIYPRITSQNFRSFSILLNVCVICLQLKKQTMLIRYVYFLLAIQNN